MTINVYCNNEKNKYNCTCIRNLIIDKKKLGVLEIEILKLLKIFIDKYLIPTTISVVLSFITYFKTTEESVFIEKFSKTGYSVFLFCIWFLVRECIIYIVKRIKYTYQGDRKRNELEFLELLWSEVDNFSDADYKLLMRFVENGNKPYFEAGIHNGKCLLNSRWVYRSKTKFNDEVVEKVYNPSYKGNEYKEVTFSLPRY